MSYTLFEKEQNLTYFFSRSCAHFEQNTRDRVPLPKQKAKGPRPHREPLFKTDEKDSYAILSAIMASVNNTSVSTNTRPRIMAARIGPEAPGLRAMPSQAADAMRPWPSPQPNAAIPMPKATAIAASPLPPAAACSVPCPNAAGATSSTATTAVITNMAFFITASFEIAARRWFPDTVQPGSRWSGSKID